jgi:hypothetical protein
MKGQAQVIVSAVGLVFIVILVLVGLVVYGSITDAND